MKKVNIKGALTNAASVAAGAVGAASLNKIDFVKSQDPMITAIGKVVIGAFLPTFLGKKGGALATGAGNGFLAIGAIELMNATVTKDDKLSLALPAIPGASTQATAAASHALKVAGFWNTNGGGAQVNNRNSEGSTAQEAEYSGVSRW